MKRKEQGFMIFFYSQADILRVDRRAKISLYLSFALLALAMLACIVLCMQVNTGNAEQMLYTVIGLFTLAGWIAILLLRLIYFPSTAVCRHMKSIFGGEEEELEGRLSLSPAAFQIPKGILARKISLAVEGEEEPRKLNIDDRLVKKLPSDGTRVRVRTVRKFITAIEVLP